MLTLNLFIFYFFVNIGFHAKFMEIIYIYYYVIFILERDVNLNRATIYWWSRL